MKDQEKGKVQDSVFSEKSEQARTRTMSRFVKRRNRTTRARNCKTIKDFEGGPQGNVSSQAQERQTGKTRERK